MTFAEAEASRAGDSPDDAWKGVVLPAALRERLDCRCDSFRRGAGVPAFLLVTGPPGAGKTQALRAMAEVMGAAYVDAGGHNLRSPYAGGTEAAVRKIWDELRVRQPALLRIEWFEGLFHRPGFNAPDQRTPELIAAFLAAWDEARAEGLPVIVAGETFEAENVDPGVLARLDDVVVFPLPDREARFAILAQTLRGHALSDDVPAFLGDETAGMTGRELAVLVQQLVRLCHEKERSPAEAIDETLWREAFDRRR